VDAPNVNISPAQIRVDAPNIPDIIVPKIEFPTKELIKAIQLAIKGIRFPETKVSVPDINMPKEMEVSGIKELILDIKKLADAKFDLNMDGITRNNPLPVILTDEKGMPYKASMSIIGGRGGSGGVSLASSPTVYNVTMTAANTEYSKLLPTGTKKIYIKLRSLNALLKVSFILGESGTTYVTIPFGATFSLDDVDLNNVTIYFQSPTAAQSAEIICFT
jgi:hypothetical protein